MAEVVVFAIPCPPTLMPTKAELAKIFIELAHLPSKLKVMAEKILREAKAEAYEAAMAKVRPILEAAEKIKKILKQIEKALGNFPISASTPFYKKLSIPEEEWERRIGALTQEFHAYVQQKILELIGKLIPISFIVPIPVLNINVDLVKLFSDAPYRATLKSQIAEKVEHYMDLIPEPYKTYIGDLGVKCREIQAQGVWNYLMSMLQKGATKLIWDAMGKLIKKFKDIWDALGLPPLPDLLDLNVAGIINSVVSKFKAEIASLKAKFEELKKIKDLDLRTKLMEQITKLRKALYQKIIDALNSISILGYKLIDLVGGEIPDFIKSPERLINRLIEAARDFGEQWAEKLLKEWMAKIMSFLNQIGLGDILKWLTFTFCDFLKLIGMPTSISIDVGNVAIPKTA